MEMVEVRGISVSIDIDRTLDAYRTIAANAKYKCTCAHCENFRALDPIPFPPDVLAFLFFAGIDPACPAEIYEFHQTEKGKHLYGGEYYLFGEAPLTDGSFGDTSGCFDFTFTEPSPLSPQEFLAQGAICLNFVVELPWVIADAP